VKKKVTRTEGTAERVTMMMTTFENLAKTVTYESSNKPVNDWIVLSKAKYWMNRWLKRPT
jgi:hypothetical protein